MFGSRRHRPPNPPLTSATANPNAASAAATAFMSASNHKPSRSLSSAAAAAALRARPHTPTNVGEVQTKRTIRRSTSVSSASSAGIAAAARSRPTGQLKRQTSSGSMTERTFRSPSPSPHRPGSIQATDEHPPVPQIPAGHKKSASTASPGIGMQTFRTASQKIKNGHPSWYTEPSGDPSNVRTSDAPMKTTKPQLQKPPTITTTPQRPDSRSSSVNFSYPTAFRAQSPPASPTSTQAPQFSGPPAQRPASPPRSNRASMSSVGSGRAERPMIYDPNSRRMVPRETVENVEYYVKEAAGKQPRKKHTGLQREGSHLAKGTVARVRGTTVDADTGERDIPKREKPVLEATPTVEESRILEEPAVKAIITAEGKPGQYQEESERGQLLRSQDIQNTRSGSQAQSRYTPDNPDTSSPASPISGDRPSAVQEESEEVSQKAGDVVRPSRKVLDALDAVPTRQSIFEQPEGAQLSPEEASEAVKQQPTNNMSTEQVESPMETMMEKKGAFAENKPVIGISTEASTVRRSNSNSPARQARFSATPSDNLAVRHTPLPRSASPIKSALKRTSPTPREVSPSDKSSDMSGSRGASPHQREDATTPRKKSVRVSFDDRTMATVVGESAPAGDADEPTLPSPQQGKRHWFSNIGRSKRREITLDDDEIMKPRPALPSFGSIREKKARDLGERPLVRPHEPSHSPVIPSSPELHSSNQGPSVDSGTPEELSLGQSSDQAIGPILAQAQTSRNAPNISRFREPLPPVVTSVEGSGYISDSIRSSDSDDDLLDSVAGASDTEELPNTQITQPETEHDSQNDSTVIKDQESTDQGTIPETIDPQHDIPEIAVIRPSPKIPEQNALTSNASINRFFDVPGSFPDNDSDATRDGHTTTKDVEEEATNSYPPSASPIFEPKAAVHPIQPETLPQTTLATTTPLDAADGESTDGSEASVYSDAYEDLSDVEGDGFLSLDAVVEKPMDKTSASQLSELPGDVPKELNVTSRPRTNEQLAQAVKSPEPVLKKDDWEKAKAFWRSLTAEKRLQLEREAMEEAGTEGDEEDVARPVRRNSGKKKVTHQRQTVTVAQPQTSTALTAPTEPASTANSERAYIVQSGSKPSQEPVGHPSTSSRMRTSLRAEKPEQVDGMRKTLRAQVVPGQGGRSSTPRAAQRENPTSVSSRPSQAQHATSPSQALSSNRPQTALPSDRPSLPHRESDASDSSFARSRPSRGGGFLRRSMRPQSSGIPHDVTTDSGRFSLRSLSPTGSSFRHSLPSNPVGAAPPPAMRRTLRSGSVSSQERFLPSIHFPSFGRSKKAPSAKRSKKSSRFGDSDDEDEAGLPNFRSRFDDSSDEESVRPTSSSQATPFSRGTLRASTAGAAGFRRATPVPEVDEDSPALPDSDDGMPSPLQSPRARPPVGGAGLSRSNSEALGTVTLTRSRSGRGGFNTSVSMPAIPNRERRSSLMGILRRNKRADSAGKIQRSELMESAARRDTRLERSNEQLRDIRDRPSSPRLQKRASVRRNDNWPLGEAAEVGSMKRSNSAGNLLDAGSTVSAAQRPDLSGRRSTSLGLPAAYDDERDNATVDGLGYRKKKKFGALRRMFGLDV
ncbi:hypothetical protein F5Y05DRAFT_376344 [Hypoxylon sp. FL0543]|nr:hypothetical protein F5Y05DRAFT_376344 [Hypoxylon sp. FL0543]